MNKDPMFQVMHDGPHGDTVYSSNPQLAAMKQAAYLRLKCDITCQIIFNDDGTVTVQGTALAPITYERSSNESEE